MPKETLTAEVLSTLRQYDSPTICNVIELFDVRPRNTGYMNSDIKALFPELPAIVGYASTAEYRSAAPPMKDERQSSFLNHVEALSLLPAPRIVVIQDLDSPLGAAAFGEVMCAVLQRLGCVGLITNGAGRDLHAVRNLGFPCFASSVCVSHGYYRFIDVHQPVHVGGLTISSGDLIHADANGVVAIPVEIAKEVALVCPRWIEAERKTLDYLKRDDVTAGGLRQVFEELEEEIQSLPIVRKSRISDVE
jgi:regulator of RNase E activity RraA